MCRTRFFVLLPAIVLLACDRTPNGPQWGTPPSDHPSAPAAGRTYQGLLQTGTTELDALYLSVPDGPIVRLVGSEVFRLANVVGTEVRVRGTLDAVNAVIVESFQVMGAGGLVAADGCS